MKNILVLLLLMIGFALQAAEPLINDRDFECSEFTLDGWRKYVEEDIKRNHELIDSLKDIQNRINMKSPSDEDAAALREHFKEMEERLHRLSNASYHCAKKRWANGKQIILRSDFDLFKKIDEHFESIIGSIDLEYWQEIIDNKQNGQ
jgi:DNA-binding transcriptional MerR regulator